MKKIAALTIAVVVTLSCSGDDDNDNVSLTGTWKLTSATLPEAVDFNNDGTASTDVMTETGCLNNSTIVFTDNVATAIVNMQTVDIRQQNNGTYTVECGEAETEYAPFAESEHIVTLTSDVFYTPFTKVGNRLTTNLYGGSVVFTKQ
ncbi:hypothetical protein GR160_11585 [Flavobacterium sp. Sd200]|uniref:lipocalin family protein n=1 Tax=Flavobacterium sp. Sd200 TaxID=2692211 RepID=UPI001371ECE2|nr:lipocalin family protein [Flavobacterium sp. Sd200]MXN91864.1 hypothetical protein [Flavobacterium sp. Sd200]